MAWAGQLAATTKFSLPTICHAKVFSGFEYRQEKADLTQPLLR
jgi:hypothetical protein